MIEFMAGVILALQFFIVGMLWRQAARNERLLINAQRAAAGLPSKANAKPPPADVLLRRAHTREQEAAFDESLKAAHEEFNANHREQFERTWRAQQGRT